MRRIPGITTLIAAAAAIAAGLQPSPVAAQNGTPRFDDELFGSLSYRYVGPLAGRAGHRGRRPRGPAVHLLHGRHGRRRVEDHRQRPQLAQPLGRVHRHRVDRRDPGRRLESRRRVRVHRIGRAAQQRDHRRRGLQILRRRGPPGSMSDWSTPGIPGRSSYTRPTPTWCTWRRSATPLHRTTSGASTAAATGARTGRTCCSCRTAPARSTSSSRPTTRAPCTRACGRRSASPGRSSPVACRAASSFRGTAGTAGIRRPPGSPPASAASRTWRSAPAIPTGSTCSSRRRPTSGACTAPTTGAPPGVRSPTSSRFATGRSTTTTWMRTRPIPTFSGRWPRATGSPSTGE